MPKSLVIVESPTKATKIGKILGSDYIVESSVGHIRDLPANAAEVPAEHKGKPWASMGVDTEHDFEPVYVVNPDKKKTVANLRKLVKQADELILATDKDREGEAIAWHLLEVLQPRVPVRRMVFGEITDAAIRHAIEHTIDLDERLVDAQEARRILDRLYGYELSPVLWKKINPGLSAGRVQSVATRIVVERERERMAFVPASYWDLSAELVKEGGSAFESSMTALDGARLASGRDFDQQGRLTSDGVARLDETRARAIAAGLEDATFTVSSVETKPYRRKPPAPFSTSTLQQEAGRKLRFSSSRTMQVAQRLYENGYITYMRTDSTMLSDSALTAARDQIRARYGDDYLPDSPRIYAKKSKNAQEAHEAVRPSGETFRTPDELRGELGSEERRLYELIWTRTIASQMTDAVGQTVSVRLEAPVGSQGGEDAGATAQFSASGRTITFPGFFRAYVEGSDDPEEALADRETFLPPMAEGDVLSAEEVTAEGHETKPPARYNEPKLVQKLEELGVGRPSTYASIISTIIGRGYVWKKSGALVPSFTAFAVVSLLERHFAHLVDYEFTAKMEDDLDEIAAGNFDRVPWLSRFYFGGPEGGTAVAGAGSGGPSGDGPAVVANPLGLKEMVTDRLDEIDAAAINSIPLGQDSSGTTIVARVGRYGPYLQRGEDTASLPDDIVPDELTPQRAEELLEAPNDDRLLGTDPETDQPVVARNGRFGPYVQLGDPADGKPEKTASLFSSMSLDTIELSDALRLLSLPREIGRHPEDGEPITVQNGRYGPYLKWGKETRSLGSESELFTVTLDDGLKLLAQDKKSARQRSNPVLRELGTDKVSEQPMSVRNGRFGAYVTDGEVNASLRKGDTVENLTDERASELLQMRRERMAAKGQTPKKSASRKKATKKKSAKKTSAKKASSARKRS
ncbi:type I DNA topoisomerase [Euzebya sp.]|uniref:type I DNA topoisomerase n=1 Tax=Euzebya sp. TaxID=1971409 RepID=UPI0035180358